ncbi:amidohydrolase family protein [Shewanella sp. D64]|uniref:amidohydrolase family protein n=1 Tax=unclassified Shewanella TaxID=196818 RepID=UPI0022BA44F0|nr:MULTISPECIES: amidohydrolase family protein [unclassified Shewanella]MEC4723970.1 amidohydrolase family protein [Shewanella sp. D64]MEC4735990.1 amidohydrolase family protein [Shewanella sp. E94]WBJ93048.1 amidohydrolase family protein [Shewanella sp. MTB7]
MLRVDSHQHFWQLSRGDYQWLSPAMGILYRDYLPVNIEHHLRESHVGYTVLVQAAASLEETEFMLTLAENNEFITGVVGWVDLNSPAVIQHMKQFSRSKYFKGIRPMLQDIADPNWILDDRFTPVFEYLIEHDMCFDALVNSTHLDAILLLLKRFPDLNLVIDHAAKPQISHDFTRQLLCSDWYNKMSDIANETNALCEISGLVTEARISNKQPIHFSQLKPYFETLYALFGAERLMWGSDWPVVTLAAEFSEWVQLSDQFINTLTEVNKCQIWSKNANNFYKLGIK